MATNDVTTLTYEFHELAVAKSVEARLDALKYLGLTVKRDGSTISITGPTDFLAEVDDTIQRGSASLGYEYDIGAGEPDDECDDDPQTCGWGVPVGEA